MGRQMDRRTFLRTATIGSLAAAAQARAFASGGEGRRPNILYIMSDDHAAHAIGCYGSAINRTPHIDRIAREGVRLRNCFCTNSLCGPSRAVILTGKHSHANGFTDNRSTFDGSQQTFPKLLQQAGYETAIIGKWHLVSDPTGFDYWRILPGQGQYHDPVFLEMGTRAKCPGYVTDLIADFSLDWLRRRDGSRPFLLMCHNKAPHRAWEPDDKHAHLFEDGPVPLPPTLEDDWATRSDAAREQEMTILRHLTDTDLKGATPPEGLSERALRAWKYQVYIKDYLRCVASVDDNVGRLLGYLDESGLAENTLVVYTSDQGFFLGDHGWFDKRFMYEESLRMPFVARLPGVIAPGTETEDLAQNLDFAPTFLELAGSAAPSDMQGRSLVPVLTGRTPADWREAVYYHYTEYPAVHMVKRHYGIRTRRYKLIHFYHDIDAWELYDLAKDPRELRNVYDDPAYAATAATLRDELERLRVAAGDDSMRASEAERHPDFAATRSARVVDSPMGYEISSDASGYALQALPSACGRRISLSCRMRSLRTEGTRNGLLCLGPTTSPGDLLKCGVYIGAGEAVILHGAFGGAEEEIVRAPFDCDRGKTFALRLDVDLRMRHVRLTVDGATEVTAPLRKPWGEVRYVGYNVNATATAFSPIRVEGE